MASGVAITGNLSQLLTKDHDKIFFDEYTRREPEWKKIAKVQNLTKNSWKEGQLVGFGSYNAVGEGQPLDWEIPVQGNTKTVTVTDYAKGYQVTRKMVRDDLTGHIKKMPAELGKSAVYTQDLKFADLFNSGFGTTRVGIDAKALFADNHTCVGAAGTTIDNQGTAAALSQTSLQLALDYGEGMVNEKGISIIMKPLYLVIPKELKWKAKDLLLNEYKPYSADNDKNNLYDEGLTYVVNHYLTSTTAWFVVFDVHDLRFIWREQVSFQNSDDFNTGNALFKGLMAFTCDFFDYRGVYGNAGA